MIAIPIWLLLLMIVVAAAGVIGGVIALERAEETVDRILDAELWRPKGDGPGRAPVALAVAADTIGRAVYDTVKRYPTPPSLPLSGAIPGLALGATTQEIGEAAVTALARAGYAVTAQPGGPA